MITYQPELWQTAYWRRGDRYYHCELKQNLFADWVVDYVAMARDWLLGGEIFTIDIVDETNEDKTLVHIFSNRPTS